MMPVNQILRKCGGGYKFTKSHGKINHFIYMDDINQFEKMKKNWRLLYKP